MGARGEERLKAITDAGHRSGGRARLLRHDHPGGLRSRRHHAGRATQIRQEQERAADAGAASIRRFQRSRRLHSEQTCAYARTAGAFSSADARVLPDHRRGHHETPATHTAVSGAAAPKPSIPITRRHEYYAQRGGRLRAQIGSYPWKLPPEYNTPQKIGLLSMCVGSAMEGLQSRWLGEPDIDFMSSWSQYEDILFPRPHWNGYR